MSEVSLCAFVLLLLIKHTKCHFLMIDRGVAGCPGSSLLPVMCSLWPIRMTAFPLIAPKLPAPKTNNQFG